jgi:hypothetical protein
MRIPYMTMAAFAAVGPATAEQFGAEGFTEHVSLDAHVGTMYANSIDALPSQPVEHVQLLMNVRQPRLEWTKRDEKRFDVLATKAALDGASTEELDELAIMEDDRNALLSPRSPEEIRLDYERSVLTNELVEVLERYVAFIRSNQTTARR